MKNFTILVYTRNSAIAEMAEQYDNLL